MVKKIVLLFGIMSCCLGVSRAQFDSCYEFKCDYLDEIYKYPIRWCDDTLFVAANLFYDINASREVFFSFENNCVYLSVNGQKGFFFGDSAIGNWNLTKEEWQRFTVRWDSTFCVIENDTVFKFEFAPYYTEINPYVGEDDVEMFQLYYDMTYYYWTRENGIIAIKGDWLFVRRGFESYKDCLKTIW